MSQDPDPIIRKARWEGYQLQPGDLVCETIIIAASLFPFRAGAGERPDLIMIHPSHAADVPPELELRVVARDHIEPDTFILGIEPRKGETWEVPVLIEMS